MKLFDIIEDNQVKGFNDEVLKTIVNMYLLKPHHRDNNQEPTLPVDDSKLIKQNEYIKQKPEEIIEEEEDPYL